MATVTQRLHGRVAAAAAGNVVMPACKPPFLSVFPGLNSHVNQDASAFPLSYCL